MERKIVIAMLGFSKSGKTSFINSLSYNPQEMLNLYTQVELSSKVTISYEYIPCRKNSKIGIKKINWNIPKIACGGNFDAYNKAVKENEIYQKLGLKEIVESADLHKDIDIQLNNIEKNITTTQVIEFVNMEHIDNYIISLIITIPANEVLSTLLVDKDIILIIRDTKDLFDIMLEAEKNSKNGDISIKSLLELGWQNINAILFMSRGYYQDSITKIYNKIYNKMFSAVLDAVPTFLAYKEDTISMMDVKTIEEAEETIKQQRKNQDLLEDRFYEALNFLNQFGKNGKYDEKPFALEEVEYFFPNCMYLSKLKRKKAISSNPLDDNTFVSYSKFTTYTICDIINKLSIYYNGIHNLFENKMLSNIFRKNRNAFQEGVRYDFKYYSGDRYKELVSYFALPQVKGEDEHSISQKMCDSSIEVLGPKGGITTKRGKKFIFIASLVSGVTLERALRKRILDFDFYKEIPLLTEDNNIILKKVLCCVLNNNFVDYDAVFQDYLLINRWIIERNINLLRENNVQPDKAMFEFAGYIFDDFCTELEKISEQEIDWYIND